MRLGDYVSKFRVSIQLVWRNILVALGIVSVCEEDQVSGYLGIKSLNLEDQVIRSGVANLWV